MDPITRGVDKVEELLGHSPHPAIVSLPIGAWAFSNLSDGLALLTGERKYDDAARLSLAVGLVGAAGAAITGLHDYGKIPSDRESHGIATTHALGNSAVASLMVASYVMRERDHALGRPASLSSRLLAIAGGGLMMYTAWLGGKLVEEYGEGVKPVQNRLPHPDQEEGSIHESHGRARLDPSSPLGLS